MKRKRSAHVGNRPPKRPNQSTVATPPDVDHPVLQCLYPDVLTLRHYLLSKLSNSSRNRQKKLSHLGASGPGQELAVTSTDGDLGLLLDSTLVGVFPATGGSREDVAKARNHDIKTFSQQVSNYSTGGTYKPGYFQQGETVDFVIWLLFKRSSAFRPSHLLCYGFQRAPIRGEHDPHLGAARSVPGVFSHHRNTFVDTLKDKLWRRLHSLLGQNGDRIMMDLLLDCGIFCRVDGNPGNYYQLSGIPISDLKPQPVTSEAIQKDIGPGRREEEGRKAKHEGKTPGEIAFCRNRMFYAKAALNGKGGVRFGMRHIHILNRFPDCDDVQQTVHIMRYIFPRQFGMHNAFTSQVDRQETSMPFKDYTVREPEIELALHRATSKRTGSEEQKEKLKTYIPKRLRGETAALVDRLRKLNQKCSYVELLRHYCPVEGLNISPRPDWRKNRLQSSANHSSARSSTQSTQRDKGNEANVPQSVSENRVVEQTCFTDMACPAAHVSAFCRAVIARVIPNGFWGDDQNKRLIMYWIDQFVMLRRFETLTLHQVIQKFQISSLAWLRIPGKEPGENMAKSDFDKRMEIFLEFVYWVFDSFLIPLIRSNFHVTESNVHRQKVFYFRHDVWRMLTEPSLTRLKNDLYEEVPADKVEKLLNRRSLGYSKFRLLPKSVGVRTITNLKRRQPVTKNGVTFLGKSINQVMRPVFNAVNYEKSLQPARFGSSLFSPNDVLPKLKSFRKSLQDQGLANTPLYFAKVDVQSCFDTIPQKHLLSMMESLMCLEEYQSGKYVEVRSLGKLQCLKGDHVNPAPEKSWIPYGRAAGELIPFDKLVRDTFAAEKANTVFVDTAVRQCETRDDLIQLLREHVERNLVKIGKRFYRQKTGIPQGSVLSTILCNFFYAQLEQEHLGFCLGPESLLLRLLDDFCLITADRDIAEHFVRIMHRGHPEYGVTVKASKSLANFDCTAEDGYQIARHVSDKGFPYCGVLIDTRTLEVSKSGKSEGRCTIADSLTVDFKKVPGQSFHRKTLNAFKIQLNAMYIDTSFNSIPTVLANLYASFANAAVRCYEYTRCLQASRTMSKTTQHEKLLINTIESIIALAHVMLQRRSRNKTTQNVELLRSAISRRQIQWLACKAFAAAFQRKQTRYQALLRWLRGELDASRPFYGERAMLEAAVAASE